MCIFACPCLCRLSWRTCCWLSLPVACTWLQRLGVETVQFCDGCAAGRGGVDAGFGFPTGPAAGFFGFGAAACCGFGFGFGFDPGAGALGDFGFGPDACGAGGFGAFGFCCGGGAPQNGHFNGS